MTTTAIFVSLGVLIGIIFRSIIGTISDNYLSLLVGSILGIWGFRFALWLERKT